MQDLQNLKTAAKKSFHRKKIEVELMCSNENEEDGMKKENELMCGNCLC
jgi:hypothetical protein